MKEIKKMKVVELRAELKRRGLPTDGLKAVLAARLQDDEDQRQQQAAAEAAAAVEESAADEPPAEDMEVDQEEAPKAGPEPEPEEQSAPEAEPVEAAKPEAPVPPAPAPAPAAEEAEEDNEDKMDVSDDDDDDETKEAEPENTSGRKAEQEKPPAPAEDAKPEEENPAAAATAASAAPLPLPPPPPPPAVPNAVDIPLPPPPPPPAPVAAAAAPTPPSTGIRLTPEISALLTAATSHLETRRVHLTELESSLLLSTTLLRHPEGLSSAQATKLPGAVRDAWHALGDGCRPMGREAAASGVDDLGVLGIEAAAMAGAAATATSGASGGEEGGGARPGDGMEVVVTPGQLGVASRSAALSTAVHRAVEVSQQLAKTKSGEQGVEGGGGGGGGGTSERRVQVVQDVTDMLRQIDEAAKEAEEAAPGGGGGDAGGGSGGAANTTKGSTDVLLEAFYARLSEVREYHAKHEVAEDAVMAAVGGGGGGGGGAMPAAAATADDAAMDIDESSRQRILALTQGSKRRKIRHGNPQADGYDLHSLLLTEMSKVRGGDLYSPQEVFGKYLDLTDVHDGLAAGVGGGSSGSGSATLRAELSKVAAAVSTSTSAGSATSKPAASSADMEEEKKDDDGASASVALPYVDFLSLLTQPLGTLLPEPTKLNNRKPYVRFLSALYDYLLGFLRRTMPLLDVEGEVIRPALDEFERTWGETGGYPGWESRVAEKVLASTSFGENNAESSTSSARPGTNIDLASYAGPQELCDAVDADTLKAELSRIGLKCGGAPLDRAKRLFLLKDTALSDLPKKVWAKGRGPPPPAVATSTDGDTKPEGASDGSSGSTKASVPSASSALTSSSLAGSSRRIDVARLEVATQSLLDQLRPTLDATVRRAERQLYQTSNERENELDEEINGIAGVRGKKPKDGKDKGDGEDGDSDDDSDEEDAPIYNPKGVPLGWDGKPIPYWLFKLHGLNHFYSCEICGNESYRGRHNFEKHFQESKHVYGMRCLGIPNTRHFHGVTKIEDAQHLWAKLQQTVEGNVFDGEKEEEYEDSHGNVLTRKTYEDLSRQGLL